MEGDLLDSCCVHYTHEDKPQRRGRFSGLKPYVDLKNNNSPTIRKTVERRARVAAVSSLGTVVSAHPPGPACRQSARTSVGLAPASSPWDPALVKAHPCFFGPQACQHRSIRQKVRPVSGGFAAVYTRKGPSELRSITSHLSVISRRSTRDKIVFFSLELQRTIFLSR